MDSLAEVKRLSAGLLNQIRQALPSISQLSPRRHPQTQPSSLHAAMEGSWEPIDVPPLARSSHSIDVVSGSAYVFGGEVKTSELADNDMHIIGLPFSGAHADYHKIKAHPAAPDNVVDDSRLRPASSSQTSVEDDEPGKGKVKVTESASSAGDGPSLAQVPAPRSGHATATIGLRIFLFGGRGGPDMQPLEEAGRVWVYDTRSHSWTYLDPAPAVKGGAIVPHPAPRSGHCATATDRPRDFIRQAPPPAPTQSLWSWAGGGSSGTGIPQDPLIGAVAEEAVDEESDGYGTLFVHAGCLANRDLTNDLWAFDIRARTWTELPAAPGPPRVDAAVCISKSRLFRFGGFDGKQHIGNRLDFLPLELDTWDDGATKSEISVRSRPGGWQIMYREDDNGSGGLPTTDIAAEPLQTWPSPRRAAALQTLTTGGGREYLVLAMGESGPIAEAERTSLGDDVWALQIPPLGMTTASLTDAALQAIGRKTGQGRWTKVAVKPYEADEGDMDSASDGLAEGAPAPRAWLASAPMMDVDENGIVMLGGVGDGGRTMDDAWILRIEH